MIAKGFRPSSFPYFFERAYARPFNSNRAGRAAWCLKGPLPHLEKAAKKLPPPAEPGPSPLWDVFTQVKDKYNFYK